MAAGASAQLTESIDVHLLEIEASVLDRGGRTVGGMSAEDFEVTVDGERVRVTNFFLVRRGVIVEERGAAGSPPAEMRTEIIPTRIVLFVDDMHLHQRSKKRAVEALRTFVDKTMDDATTAMLVRWNGSLTIEVPATKDRARLLKAIDAMATEPARMRHIDSHRRSLDEFSHSMDPGIIWQHKLRYAESRQRETTRTIDALREVTRAVGGLEGRKLLLHVSEGLPLIAGWEMLATADNPMPPDVMRFNLSEDYHALTKFAQQAGVAFCLFDPSGPDGASYAVDLPGGNPNPGLIRENHRNTAVLMARQTGGQLIADTNELDLALALAQVTDQLTTYYSIGVSAPPNRKGPFNIKVTVPGRPELRVVTSPRRSVQSRAEMITNGVRARLYLRDETNPLDAQLRVDTPRRDGKRCSANLVVSVPASKLTLFSSELEFRGEVSLHFAVIDDRQQESGVRSTTKEIRIRPGDDVTESVALGLKPRKYLVSVAVVETLSGEASYLQREIDATVCAVP